MKVKFNREAFEAAVNKYGRRYAAELFGITESAISYKFKRDSSWKVDDVAALCSEMDIDPAKFFTTTKTRRNSRKD